MKRKPVKLYNVLFPVWMLMLFPTAWLIVLPGNFIIDSLVLLVGMKLYKIAEKKRFYLDHIAKIYVFGLISDAVGAAFMLLLIAVFKVGNMGDELYITAPALLISAVCIFVFNYFVTFKKSDRALRLRLAFMYAAVTAPYTFMIPSSWIYSF